MIRGVMGVVAGLLAGGLSVFLAEAAGHIVFPPPEGLDLTKPEDLKRLMEVIPFGAKLSVLIAWSLGTFVGCATAIFVSARQSWPGWIVALALFSGGLWTMSIIPHPQWMLFGSAISTLIFAIIPAAIFARS